MLAHEEWHRIAESCSLNASCEPLNLRGATQKIVRWVFCLRLSGAWAPCAACIRRQIGRLFIGELEILSSRVGAFVVDPHSTQELELRKAFCLSLSFLADKQTAPAQGKYHFRDAATSEGQRPP